MKGIFIFLFLVTGISASIAQEIIKSTDTRIHYMGRVAFAADAAELNWSGNAVTINFNGTGVKAILRDETGKNYVKVIVDGQPLKDIQTDSLKHLYEMVSGLSPGDHQLQLFKRTEAAFGKIWFYQFETEMGTILKEAPETKKRRIEFYGNSITCGYGVLDTTGQDRGTPPFEDNYFSYSAITARHFNAEYSCIARSGIGILVSWFPQIMPEMYDRIDITDSTRKWDFGRYDPQIVVVNLFQNDSWLVKRPEYPEFKHRFNSTSPSKEKIVAAYRDFVKNIRGKYPDAEIICVLGNMDATRKDSEWPGYVSAAVDELADKKIKTLFFPFKDSPGHPSVKEQQAMADMLINYIEQNIEW